ncbi:unnamed protein product (macronuclear) [Paramecium tetraurelia]|uniref:Uncharacterized protein n=1 Tax=Paramecium tetraurelia TaxID=5888 RepID=A0D9K8_PARTE|nr:uncharacterized protein GSPATT00014655001 [Paramecium tetraurelia]CAK79725.1 unnamed protein product [Paramecium tetraurelia]|eukprot:XP_001447122.1 hypothetical protein (macronuclear) [Paramecium tetraurelia strain d4-2]
MNDYVLILKFKQKKFENQKKINCSVVIFTDVIKKYNQLHYQLLIGNSRRIQIIYRINMQKLQINWIPRTERNERVQELYNEIAQRILVKNQQKVDILMCV